MLHDVFGTHFLHSLLAHHHFGSDEIHYSFGDFQHAHTFACKSECNSHLGDCVFSSLDCAGVIRTPAMHNHTGMSAHTTSGK